MAEAQRGFVLPVSIMSPTDIARLKRELDAIEGYFQQSRIRESGQQQAAMPRLSKLMDQLAIENKLNLLQEDHRAYVLKSLEALQASAPIMHISFSVDPPGLYVQKIVYWLRSNVHAQVLVTVGLQPNIGAGCIVRTTNRIFDFSLREYFNAKRDFFIERMHEAISDQPVTDVAGATQAAQTVSASTPATQPVVSEKPADPVTAPTALVSAADPAAVSQVSTVAAPQSPGSTPPSTQVPVNGAQASKGAPQ